MNKAESTHTLYANDQVLFFETEKNLKNISTIEIIWSDHFCKKKKEQKNNV
jgi:hypothetical protein